MSRYYSIQITGTPKPVTYTSFPNGKTDPGALEVILDIYATPIFGLAQGMASAVQIWGVPLADLSQANQLTGKQIAVYGGFQKGLPLNKPQQSGLLCAGTIWQAFGNWQGTDMTLDFVIVPNAGTQQQPVNISFLWTAGTSLADALKTTISTAFPGAKFDINISPNLIVAHDEVGFYSTMYQFCQMLKAVTQSAIGGSYPGVDIILKENTFVVFDGSTPKTPVQLNFEDMIGQPTYIDAGTIQFVCPMRADLAVNDAVTMPKGFQGVPGAVQTTQASQPQTKQKSAFSGSFSITQVHHMGDFRQPDGQSWVTAFNAIPAPV